MFTASSKVNFRYLKYSCNLCMYLVNRESLWWKIYKVLDSRPFGLDVTSFDMEIPGDLRVCDLQWPQAEHWNQWTCVVSLVYFSTFRKFQAWSTVGQNFEFMIFLGLTSMAASPPTPRHRTHWSFHWSRGGVAWNVCLRRISSMEVNHLGNARATTRPQLVTFREDWKNWIWIRMHEFLHVCNQTSTGTPGQSYLVPLWLGSTPIPLESFRNIL